MTLVAGGYDYLIKTRVANVGAYRDMIGKVNCSPPKVRTTLTYTVM